MEMLMRAGNTPKSCFKDTNILLYGYLANDFSPIFAEMVRFNDFILHCLDSIMIYRTKICRVVAGPPVTLIFIVHPSAASTYTVVVSCLYFSF